MLRLRWYGRGRVAYVKSGTYSLAYSPAHCSRVSGCPQLESSLVSTIDETKSYLSIPRYGLPVTQYSLYRGMLWWVSSFVPSPCILLYGHRRDYPTLCYELGGF